MKKILVSLVAALVLLVSVSASAQMKYIEGRDYTVLENPLALQKTGQEEVIEFFSFVCGHCYNLESHIVKWSEEKKPVDVGFYQVPAVGGKLWTFVGRVKLVADKLALGKKFDERYFEELHKNKNRRLAGDKDSVIAFMTEFGADKLAAEKAWDSLAIKAGLKKSAEMWTQAKLTGVPTVVVNGQYVVSLTNDYEAFFEVIEYLLATTDVPKA